MPVKLIGARFTHQFWKHPFKQNSYSKLKSQEKKNPAPKHTTVLCSFAITSWSKSLLGASHSSSLITAQVGRSLIASDRYDPRQDVRAANTSASPAWRLSFRLPDIYVICMDGTWTQKKETLDWYIQVVSGGRWLQLVKKAWRTNEWVDGISGGCPADSCCCCCCSLACC